ncbi:response regulator transcription factor [Neorhizobium sp. IRS_2294]|uniref:helix-turn-helix transcriptional regulator n=1 Tax=unclassified Neorhizobium TaxID=2629175 RepID=UPI003D285A57
MITLERQSILNGEISAAYSRAEISTVFERATREFGLRHFALVKLPPASETLLSRIIVETNLPKDYIREFDRLRLLPRTRMADATSGWSLPDCCCLDDRNSPGQLPPDLIALRRQYGMITSVAMALHSVDGTGFRIRMSGDRPRLTQTELNEIGMVILHAFAVFDRIRRSEQASTFGPLTTRELEVVRWTAQGKTSSEIGKILSLSDHTVNAYMTNAIKKLDCVNRTQLVAKALRLRLIS